MALSNKVPSENHSPKITQETAEPGRKTIAGITVKLSTLDDSIKATMNPGKHPVEFTHAPFGFAQGRL